jgi:hypothetical protein
MLAARVILSQGPVVWSATVGSRLPLWEVLGGPSLMAREADWNRFAGLAGAALGLLSIARAASSA